MKADQIKTSLASLQRKGGQAAWVDYCAAPSGLNAAAKREGRILKRSKIPLQLAEYGNRAAVAAAVADGEREAPKMRDCFEFVERLTGGAYIARHKTTGQEYFCAPRQNIDTVAEYLLDGEVVAFEAIKQYFMPSALAPKPSKADANEKGQDLFNMVKLESIQGIA